MFILIEKENYHVDFYEGKTYQYQGDIYPCVCSNQFKAKKYKSFKIAQNACKWLNKKTGRNFQVSIYDIFKL
ncbi:hypothetical protein C3495_14265 (plasmid) [Clostridiaceae bacterium 14S0207]|nr:hypothetical protein C3495_14265 [Clostridiaceae bacterium 14S0207]